MNKIKLAVNGTLMRGLELEENLTRVGARFLSEDKTEPFYRLWSIDDIHPAMIRVGAEDERRVSVELEVWEVPAEGLADILAGEPAGLSIGKVKLLGGETVLGVIAEPELVKGQKEISSFGGWRNYLKNQ